MTWNVMIILLSFCLFAFLFIQQWKRQDKDLLWLRISATLLAVAALACCILPITCTANRRVANREAILLTEGCNKDSVRRFISQETYPLPVFSLVRSVPDFPKVSYIADVTALRVNDDKVRSYHVFGYGLRNDELISLQKSKLTFHPSGLPQGITSIYWRKKLPGGDRLLVEGSYHNTFSSPLTMVLSGFGEALDSILLPAESDSHFSLSLLPKPLGRVAYLLAVMHDHDTLEKEYIPVVILPPLPLRLVMLTSSPDFGFNFLKRDLAEQGFSVAMRSVISRNKYAYDYVNESPDNTVSSPLDSLTSSDVVIIDASGLTLLSRPDLTLLQAQVAQKGLGLIILADTMLPARFPLEGMTIVSSDTGSRLPLQLYWQDTATSLPPLAQQHLPYLRNNNQLLPLLWDREKKIYAAGTLYGAGKVVVFTVSNSYQWLLSGNGEAYHRLWSMLLRQVAKPADALEEWNISPALPAVHSPANIQLLSGREDLPATRVNNCPVYLENNPGLPFRWQGVYFPEKEGWQIVQGAEGRMEYWYAFDTAAWAAVKAAEKEAATARFSKAQTKFLFPASGAFSKEESEVSTVYFFLLFLLSVSFLWAEGKKLFTGNL